MKKLFFCLLLLSPVLASALDETAVQVEELVKTSQSWDGTLLPAYTGGQPEITIIKITVPPHVELGWHSHPTINAGVMIKGELTVLTKSGEEHVLSAGEGIVEVLGKIHRGINKGSEPAEIIVFYAGAVDQPLTTQAH